MKAKERRFLHFLEGSDKHFVIPVYQRNYDWKQEHCKQLFNDLIDVSENSRTHFLGSLVSIYNDNGEDREYLIIDGQQRVTTLSLCLLAMYKIIEKELLDTTIKKEQIKDEYLINKYSNDEKKIRLKPVKNDKEAFSALFKDEEDFIENSNITINYKYFYNRILEEEISLEQLFAAIRQLVIVEIELKNGEDDPQLIFESLNSTGLDLTEADKVRNFILMKETPSKQEEFYNDYWNRIEKNTNYNVSDFIRDYLTIKERAIPNKNKVYFHFKKYVNENFFTIEDIDNVEPLLKDLLQFSKYYKAIINSSSNSNTISKIIYKINKLESIVTYPFIMEVMHDKEEKIINEQDVESILNIIVNYVFRRLICEVPTNALNKIFMVLGREIKRYNNYENNYVDIFKYVLVKKRLSQRFPENDEFSEKIMLKDIYNFKNKNKLFLLEQLENYNNKERVELEHLINNNELTIEHIMPRKLNNKWRNMLGEKHDEIYHKYLHTIGNITLTGYNSEMSNRPFQEKRDMEKGFKHSRLYLNEYIKECEIWNENTIIQRANILKDRALKIWEYPSTNFIPEEDNEKFKLYTLSDEDVSFAGEKIITYRFMDEKEKSVKSWKEFFIDVNLELSELDQVKFKQIVFEHHYDYDGVSKDKDSFAIDGFHMYTNLSADSILTRLRILVDKIGFDLDDISFTIK
ncbi:DUF262 domain-containing protein [Candidatus Marinarcus aquaticus]|uniref:DUF262 domain-containing protein n=1 Tax=Candidatus Marinarcus aquaticus TaxID=2044504 RepID=A0A4Q0XQS2_9BACT|nr:DUF262 domain-containing protein [Candidatus Marinarcus aquaticus]RXJ57948.1 hypothetical protein CRV04_05425 [Candidatus Marinarcus aquaticus]